jgi:hypothetical protein
MTNVNLVIPTVQQNFPTGTVAGQWVFTVKDSGGFTVKNTGSPTPSVSYTDLLPGSYTATGKRTDQNNANLGGPTLQASFTVPDPGVLIDVADSTKPVAVTLS